MALEGYLAKVEPIRLAVNRLLARADPILTAYSRHPVGAREAERQTDKLARRPICCLHGEDQRAGAGFAGTGGGTARLRPTYILEDAYLSALAAAIPSRCFDNLPRRRVRSAPRSSPGAPGFRSSPIDWACALPPDLQVAGRGKIAHSLQGS